MKVLLFLVLTVLLWGEFPMASSSDTEDMIEYINAQDTTWKAGWNYDPGLPLVELKRLAGVLPPKDRRKLPIKWHNQHDIMQVPDNFDSRQKWPNCPTIKEIRDQGDCGSCWAFGATEAMSDRICIHSNGTVKVRLSADDLLSCCTTCGYGCGGGHPTAAWEYWVTDGIVTGGPYGSNQGCRPYEIHPHPKTSTLNRGLSSQPTPACVKQCRPGYSPSYEKDKHFGNSSYSISENVKQIQTEIMKNGPVEATFIVYLDFLLYTGGIYQNILPIEMGLHAVKILGWGVEEGTPYWLAANSWNVTFGEQGFFKILRGSNECNIESYINAGLPRI